MDKFIGYMLICFTSFLLGMMTFASMVHMSASNDYLKVIGLTASEARYNLALNRSTTEDDLREAFKWIEQISYLGTGGYRHDKENYKKFLAIRDRYVENVRM